jgi:hypothetical protein
VSRGRRGCPRDHDYVLGGGAVRAIATTRVARSLEATPVFPADVIDRDYGRQKPPEQPPDGAGQSPSPTQVCVQTVECPKFWHTHEPHSAVIAHA